MKRKFSTRIITCIATSAVLAVGTLSFTVINAIADEAVSYYGLSADGTVVSGTVTDYTRITSTDTAWGIAGKETWYVADGNFGISTTTNPLDLKGNVNVILKNGAEVSVWNGIAGTDATITFYSESESASGVIGFIGATGDDGGWGTTESGPDEANGKNGEDGKDAVNVSSFTVAGGQKTRKCEICGYTEYEDTDTDPDAHEWEENYTIDKEPTCTTEGSKSIHCSRCDATKDSTVIPVTDHTYGEWEVVTPSTCTENGVKKHACIHCGFEQTGIIEPAHEWEDSRTVDIAPSCTEQGEDSVHCRNCDERKDIKEISPKGHDWSEWKTLVEPTITSEGKEYRACNVCGIKEEKALSKLSGKKEWKHDKNKHWHVDDNGNIIDADDHEFKWVVDKEPTATEPGIGHYECIACAFEKAPEEFGKRNPETGASSLAAWIAVAAVAGGAVPVTYKARKRKNK